MDQPKLNILGGDLSLRSSGIVLLSPQNKLLFSLLLKPPPKLRDVKRIKWLMRELQIIVRGVTKTHGPMQAVLEDVAYAAPNMRVVVLLCEWLMGAKLVLDSEQVDFQCVPVTTCRKWLCGRGDVDKAFVAHRIKVDYGIEFDHDPGNDLSDACLIALWGARQK